MEYLIPLLVGVAACALTGWLVLVVLSARATRTPPVTEDPASAGEEPAPLSPALVDLITGGWRLCDRESAPATLLDLAARGFLKIEEAGSGTSMVRVRADADADTDTAVDSSGLLPYERMVYDHVRSLTAGGAVPAEALAEGPRDLRSWWRRFQRHVIDESEVRGLTRPRWSKRQSRGLWAASIVPAAAVALVFTFLPAAGPDWDNGLGPGLVTWIVLVVVLGRLNSRQGTATGARVAGQWLGVRRRLISGGEFTETPASGVEVWGRQLAYAAALGLAGRAVAGLPISRPADDGKAWSDYGGTWHVVQVRYPGIGLPAGHRLRLLRGRGRLAMVVVALVAGWFAFLATTMLLTSLDPDAFYRGFDPVGLEGETGRARSLAMAMVLAGLVGAAPLILGIVDHFSPRVVEGQVVRLRRYGNVATRRHGASYNHWIAVDEGHAQRVVTAFGIDAGRFAELAEGDVVRLQAGRLLRMVDHVESLSPSEHRATPR